MEEQVGLLAYHWERAGDAEKAMEYLLRAGDQARLAYAHEEASRLLPAGAGVSGGEGRKTSGRRGRR